jgi:hypothetical protein
VSEHRLEVILQVPADARPIGAGTREQLDAFVDHERGRPARRVTLALVDPIVQVPRLAEHVVRERLADLLPQQLLVPLKQITAHHQQRDHDTQQHEHNDLRLKAVSKWATGRGLCHASTSPGGRGRTGPRNVEMISPTRSGS